MSRIAPFRFIPSNSTAVNLSGTAAVAYLYGGHNAIGYRGNSKRPAFNYRFRDPERAQAYVDEFLKSEIEREQSTATRKAEKAAMRKAFKTSLKVGDILSGSWGYDQTNVEFFEVVEVKPSGKSVVIREIGGQGVPGSEGFMSQSVMPVPGKYTGKPLFKIVQPGDRITLNSYCSLYKWDGKAQYSSWYA